MFYLFCFVCFAAPGPGRFFLCVFHKIEKNFKILPKKRLFFAFLRKKMKIFCNVLIISTKKSYKNVGILKKKYIFTTETNTKKNNNNKNKKKWNTQQNKSKTQKEITTQ